MRCDICKEREATVFVHQPAKGGLMELRLCAPCAAAHGLDKPEGDIAGALEKLLAALPDPENRGLTDPASELSVCPQCGLSQGELRRRRSAGCPQCWELFADMLLDARPGVAGPRHRGRLSLRIEASAERERKRLMLQERLAAALAAEAYEEAASLRDALRRLEEEGSRHV